MPERLSLVFAGLSITSSWGNGHATNYRALLRALSDLGHDTFFLERDVPWYAAARDMPDPPFTRAVLYSSPDDLRRHEQEIRSADAVILGSYVPDGPAVGEWLLDIAQGITAFYDIDTPVTLAKLQRNDHEYLHPSLIPRFDLYLSFTGGPTLRTLEDTYGAQRAEAFYCLVDPGLYYPPAATDTGPDLDLGYLGTYSPDRQPALDRLLIQPARARPRARFAVAGPQFPPDISWPRNIQRTDHLPPSEHRGFYTRQRFTLNITRADMVRAGYSPSVRLFEAAACGTPIISDRWPGIEDVLTPGSEILIADSAADVLRILDSTTAAQRNAIARRARARILQSHTAAERARQLLSLLQETRSASRATA